MSTNNVIARPTKPVQDFYIDSLLWSLWDVPQVKAWLVEVPRQQRLKRLERIGQMWEGSARWAMMRSLNPALDPSVLETLTVAPDRVPFAPSSLQPPAALERLVMEIGARDGYDWAKCVVPPGCSAADKGV